MTQIIDLREAVSNCQVSARFHCSKRQLGRRGTTFFRSGCTFFLILALLTRKSLSERSLTLRSPSSGLPSKARHLKRNRRDRHYADERMSTDDLRGGNVTQPVFWGIKLSGERFVSPGQYGPRHFSPGAVIPNRRKHWTSDVVRQECALRSGSHRAVNS